MTHTTVISDPERGVDVCESCVVADRIGSRMRGLLGRAELPAHEGLLLKPAGSIHTHFMRFAIDVVFLDRDSRVVGLSPSVRPWRMARGHGASAVLELRSGEAARRGVRVGDLLQVGAGREADRVPA